MNNQDNEFMSGISMRKVILKEIPDWSAEVPFRIRGAAVLEADKARSMAISKFKKTGQVSSLKFKSKKGTQSFPVDSDNWNKKKSGIFQKYLGSMFMSEPVKAEKTGRLIKENGRYFYCDPVEITVSDNQGSGCVSIDPGVRTFATFYSPELAGELGKADASRIQRLCYHLDRLVSKRDLESSSFKRLRVKRSINRLKNKIKDLVSELHYKIAKFLTSNFKVIFIPDFETSSMSKKASRKISSKTVRSMLTLSHYSFRLKLNHLANKNGSMVVTQEESYTSKTCTCCGKLNNIGSAKTLRCSCGTVIDRDLNGARNIFLRALVAQPTGIAFMQSCVR